MFNSFDFVPSYRGYCSLFFFNYTATTEIYTLSLHDALPIYCAPARRRRESAREIRGRNFLDCIHRSEEHTSELQSHSDLVCRLLLEKKKNTNLTRTSSHQTSETTTLTDRSTRTTREPVS